MKIGVIGCGRMGTALVAGAVRSGMIKGEDILGFDPVPAASKAFAEATGGSTVDDPSGLAECGTLLLCTKPYQAASALGALAPSSPPLLISVAAGLSIEWLEEHAPADTRVIRCMPNTPALVGEGAAGFSPGTRATEDDIGFASGLLGSVGLAVEVPEDRLDAVTGLSGSGPAFVFLVIEALADGGVRCGLPRPQALQLAAQTVRGAATMVAQTGTHPGELKDQVASPGGTTIAGIAELEAGAIRSAMIRAVTAAAEKSAELGKA